MRTAVLSVHSGLAHSSRVPILADQRQGAEVAATLLLLGVGATAAMATLLLDFSLRIPGHAIIRAIFPMSLGFALAPRRMGGTTMGLGALGTALVLKTGGFAVIGLGALTSLTLIGPFLDAALWRAGRGWRLYVAFALAGLGSNLAALAVRAGTKLVGLDHAVARPLAAWLPQAVVTYAVCGALAGLISALVWFRFSSGSQDESSPGTVA